MVINMNKIDELKTEVKKVIIGKDEIIDKVLMAILADGHILLEDIPGVGKTTLALAFSSALGLSYRRIQFTPDTLPSDVTGFSLYRREKDDFIYKEGAVITNLLLADEINRTSSKTQAALLEVMEECQVTVDGVTHLLPRPFIVIATQNPFGFAGTQLLPQSQLDRFLIRLSMGMPDMNSMIKMMEDRMIEQPLDKVEQKASSEEILLMQKKANEIYVSEEILNYIALLVSESHNCERLELPVSPRGALGVLKMAKACAYMQGMSYVVPEHILAVFLDVCCHRVTRTANARAEKIETETILQEILECVPIPAMVGGA
jgi:MoxR-like ATPase